VREDDERRLQKHLSKLQRSLLLRKPPEPKRHHSRSQQKKQNASDTVGIFEWFDRNDRPSSKSCSDSKRLMSWLGLVDAEGDLVGDADAVAFEGDDFFGVIGEDANVL
jgi:hypothetical protein